MSPTQRWQYKTLFVFADTERLQVTFGGLGKLSIAELNAQRLDVDVAMPSPCAVEVSGRVGEQHVALRGLSEYRADRLDSKRATVALKEPGGHARIRADDELDVTAARAAWSIMASRE